MSANRIEVSQDDAFDRSTTVNIVLNDFLIDLFSVSVRTQCFLDRSLLCDRQILRSRLTVNGAAGREDDALDVMFGHQVKQIDETDNIIAVILQWLLNTFAYCLAGSKMNDTLYIRIFGEYCIECLIVAAVNLFECWAYACNLFDAIQYIGVRVGKVINDNHFVTSLLEFYGGVTSDKACTTSY